MLISPHRRNPWMPVTDKVWLHKHLKKFFRVPVCDKKVPQKFFLSKKKQPGKIYITTRVEPWATVWDIFNGAIFTSRGTVYPLDWYSGSQDGPFELFFILGKVSLPLGDAREIIHMPRETVLNLVYYQAEKYLEKHPLDVTTTDVFGLTVSDEETFYSRKTEGQHGDTTV